MSKKISPSSLRQIYRNGKRFLEPSFGLCTQYFQANVVMIPSIYSEDFSEFCQRNLSACPLVYKSEVGETSAPLLAEDSNIRTDLSTYNVFDDGVLLKTVESLKEYPWEDKVSFYLGCSFSFDGQLIANGIQLNTEKNVSMYVTNIDCIPVGIFHDIKLVVSMRPICKDDLDTAVECTIKSDFAHGAPIHIGSPEDIGIRDLMESSFGTPIALKENEVPVFWACGVTSVMAIKSAKLPLSFSHHPGCMFVSDIKSVDIPKVVKNKRYPKPRVLCMNNEKRNYNILSEQAFQTLNQIEFEVVEDLGNRGITNLLVKEDFAKAVLTLAKDSSHVGIIFGFPVFTEGKPLEENDGIAGAIYIAVALSKLKKNVTFIVDSRSSELKAFLSSSLPPYLENVRIDSIGKELEMEDLSFLYEKDTSKPYFSHLIAIERPSPGQNENYNTMKGRSLKDYCDPTHILFEQANLNQQIYTIGIGDGGNELGMGKVKENVAKYVPLGDIIASRVSCDYLITCGVSNWGGFAVAHGLYVLSACPVFRRFRDRGFNTNDDVVIENIVLSLDKDKALNELINSNGFRDGISGSCNMTIDNLNYYTVHRPKFQKIIEISKKFKESMQEYWHY